MRVQLEQCSPNFCFSLTDAETGDELQFVQSDYEYPSLASLFGWMPCHCGRTDGTVDCPHRKVADMLSDAYDFLCDHDGEVIDSITAEDYLPENFG